MNIFFDPLVRFENSLKNLLVYIFKSRRIIHGSSKISWRAKVRATAGGQVIIGRHCEIHDYARILSYGGKIEIGDFCTVNSFSILYGHGGLKIGNGVRIAAHSIIIPQNHIFDDLSTFIHQQGETRLGVVIEDDVWIGAGAIILDGVKIGKGSVIGAGSVVTKKVDQYSVVAGNPARLIRKRGEIKSLKDSN